jgi:hypothetical protein
MLLFQVRRHTSLTPDPAIGNALIESATTKFILGANELSTRCQGGTTVRGALQETFSECTGCIPAFRDAAPVDVADIEAGRHREFDSQSGVAPIRPDRSRVENCA